jgi:hypothetical protein
LAYSGRKFDKGGCYAIEFILKGRSEPSHVPKGKAYW